MIRKKQAALPKRELTLADERNSEDNVITIDGKEFNATSLNEQAKIQLDNLQFVNEQILQKNNELQIADSARIMYISVLNEELIKTKSWDWLKDIPSIEENRSYTVLWSKVGN